jgi:hypothetical protein
MSRHTGRTKFRMLAVPAAITAACLLAFAALPSAGTGAYWTSASAGTASAAGTAQWCSTPDPAASGARYVRLSSITTNVGTNEHMAIIPVANNAAWGGGTGTKSLGVRLWGCQTAPVGSLRVTAWSNPSPAVAINWLTGSTVAPASRLNPASGLGAQLSGLALAASTSGIYLLGGSTGDVRRYSWLIANGRTSATPAADPDQCVYLLTAVSACTPTLTNSSSADSTFAQVFNVAPFASSTLAPTTYTAHTWATQSAAGWGATNSWLNVTCGVLGLLICGTNVTTTTLTGTAATDATLLASTNGNLMQWVVVQWTGTTPPPSDLVLEVFVE